MFINRILFKVICLSVNFLTLFYIHVWTSTGNWPGVEWVCSRKEPSGLFPVCLYTANKNTQNWILLHLVSEILQNVQISKSDQQITYMYFGSKQHFYDVTHMVVWNNKSQKNTLVDKTAFPECSSYKLMVLTLSSMPTMYRVSLKAPISSWHFPYTMVMACRHIHFIWTLGVRRKRW